MWELDYKESWLLKNWCFWIAGEDLRVPWKARRSNQSILKEIIPEYSLEGLMLKLKLQYFGHLMWRADSFEKTLMLGKIEGRRRRGMTEDEMVGWHHWLDGHEFEQVPGVGDGQGSLVCCSPWFCKELDRTERLNWELAFCMPCSMTKKTEKNCETPFPFPKPCSSLFFSLLTVSYWHLPWDLQNYYSEKERQSFCFPMFVIVKIYYFLFYFSGTVLTSFC